MTYSKTYTTTIIAPATAVGGAITVLKLSGNDAIHIANKLFSKNLENAKANSIVFGNIIDNKNIIDEVLVSIFKAPQSYTGENIVEISCHGSPYIVDTIIELALKNGAVIAEKGEFTLRAFLNGKMDLTQAEAVADLIAAETSAAHNIAIKQLKGGFSNILKTLRDKLINFASLIELELDFGEEDVEFANREEVIKLLDEIIEKTNNLHKSFLNGNAIKKGIPVAIVGKPNAGKSTLLNALVGEDRAIVTDIEGTTRDTIEEKLIINNHLFRFIDTAGLRETDSIIENIGIKKAKEAMQKAALVIYLFDASITDDKKLAKEIKELMLNEAVIIPVANKIDLMPPGIKSTCKIQIDAKNNNIESLIHLLEQKGEELSNLENEIVITNQRHFDALSNIIIAVTEAKKSVVDGMDGDIVSLELRIALDEIGKLTGNIQPNDILANIFQNFCIGK